MRLEGPQGRSVRVRKVSLPPEFDPRTIQPVASRYSDWATNQVPVVLACPIPAVHLHRSFHAKPAVSFISAQIRRDVTPPVYPRPSNSAPWIYRTTGNIKEMAYSTWPDLTQPGQGYIYGADPVQIFPATTPLLPYRPHSGHLSPASKLTSSGHSVIGVRCPLINEMHRSQLADGCVQVSSR